MRHDYVSLDGGREWDWGRWALKLKVVVPVDPLPTLKIGKKEFVEYSYDPDPLYRRRHSNNDRLCAVIEAIAVAIKRDVKAYRCHGSNRINVVIWGRGDDFAMTNEVRRHFEEFVRGGS